MKSALTYLFTVALFLTVCTETFILVQNHKEITQLRKDNTSYLKAGMALAKEEAEVKAINQNVYMNYLDALDFINKRGLGFVYNNTPKAAYDRESHT